MPQHIVIIGAGLIGAAIAENLQHQGAQVTVIEAGQPATEASGRSFGWINASFHLDEAHYHLRVAGMEAWQRLQARHAALPLRWSGCLCWDAPAEALEAERAKLAGLGYPVEQWDRGQIAGCAPKLSPEVSHALWFPSEGVAEPAQAAHALLASAQAQGARLITGSPVLALTETGGAVTGVRLAGGTIEADRVVVACGTGAPALLEPFGQALPMLSRPGALMRSTPVPPCLGPIMVSPDLEFRQDASGRILAPGAAAHQSDDSEQLEAAPDALAQDTLARLRRWLPEVELAWEEITVAMRPVPGDGQPVMGACGPDGLFVAVMHSGVTLGALAGEIMAQEVLTGEAHALAAPYRPQRF